MRSFCKCKSNSLLFSKNNSIYAIINGQSFNATLINDIIRFEQLGPEVLYPVARVVPVMVSYPGTPPTLKK